VKFFVVLVTTPNAKTSEKLSKGLVKGKLAACVNRLPGLKSRYWWKGKIETADEELLLIKTARSKIPVLTQWIKANHPYTVCEVIAFPIAVGSKDYLEWILKSINS
jgi:periplasmic divalent cation tolerance protein